jgi:hypothetical protein
MKEKGERQRPGEASGGNGSRARPLPPKLADLDVSKTQSSRWQKLADLDDSAFEKRVENSKRGAVNALDKERTALYSSESVEWYTPTRYVEAVREVLGKIDLDPASCAKANATVQAEKFFTEKDKPLEREWRGSVFLNPPYGTDNGDSVAGMFCTRALAEFEAGNMTEGIILVNSLHAQAWQAPLYEHPICFVNHRIKFVSGNCEENKSPTMSNIFVYLGRNEKKFARVFSQLGYVMRRIRPPALFSSAELNLGESTQVAMQPDVVAVTIAAWRDYAAGMSIGVELGPPLGIQKGPL